MTDDYSEKKNPFFKPALIATLISVVGLVSCYCGMSIGQFFFLPLSIPFAVFLSIGGLVDARKLQEPFMGCVLCLFIAFFEVLLLLAGLQTYLSKPISTHSDDMIHPNSASPSEIESIKEELDRALNEKPARGTTK